eukprot:scaffold6301_cov165-Amphora_coffeaeformis.AAC.11
MWRRSGGALAARAQGLSEGAQKPTGGLPTTGNFPSQATCEGFGSSRIRRDLARQPCKTA